MKEEKDNKYGLIFQLNVKIHVLLQQTLHVVLHVLMMFFAKLAKFHKQTSILDIEESGEKGYSALKIVLDGQ